MIQNSGLQGYAVSSVIMTGVEIPIWEMSRFGHYSPVLPTYAEWGIPHFETRKNFRLLADSPIVSVRSWGLPTGEFRQSIPGHSFRALVGLTIEVSNLDTCPE